MMTYDAKRNRDLMDTIKPGKAGGAAVTAEIKANPDALRGKPSLSMIGLLLVQMIIGYEGRIPVRAGRIAPLRHAIEIKNSFLNH